MTHAEAIEAIRSWVASRSMKALARAVIGNGDSHKEVQRWLQGSAPRHDVRAALERVVGVPVSAWPEFAPSGPRAARVDLADVPEEVRPLHGCPGYLVSESGRVFSTSLAKRTRELRPATNRRGYLFVILRVDGRSIDRYVHQLVLEAFVGPRPTPQHETRHLDGDPQNNHRTNLAWGTRQENREDKVRHGTASVALTESQVVTIRSRVAAGEDRGVVAAEFGIGRQMVAAVAVGNHSWRNVAGRVPAGPRGFQEMSAEDRRALGARGGRNAHARGNARRFSPEEAREAGRRGAAITNAKRAAARLSP